MASNPSTNSETGIMDTEIRDLEERLKSFMEQLQSESGIFERMVYKNKNQHRRCSYFQYLLKVRRDLRLLKLAKLEELVGSCFLVITGRKPKQKIHLLECLRWRKSECGTPNFMERLLGAARLLSQMVEPVLRAAVEVSTLLARSFFMGFSLTILALLARLRVLVQQILLDVVSVFNMVSSLSQKKQSVKITQEGIEVFREYFPTHKEFVTLACVWNTDKFVLSESVHKSDFKIQDVDGLGDTSAKSALRYHTLKAFLGDIDSDLEAGEDDKAKESFNRFEEDKKDLSCVPSTESVHGMQVEDGSDMRDNPVIPGTTDGKPSTEASPSATPRSVAFVSIKRPATSTPPFVSVKRPAPSPQNPTDVHSKGKEDDSADKEDSFFNLLSAGTTKASLF